MNLARSALPALLAVSGQIALAQAASLTAEQLRAKADTTIPARLSEPVEFVVKKGAAVRVEFAPNIYDVADFVVYFDDQDRAWYEYGYGPTSKSKSVVGSLEQIGRAPCAALVHWRRGDAGFEVGLELTDRRDRIAPAMAAIHVGERKWSMWLRNGSLWDNAPIPETERIAGFARLWSEVKYNFVFFDRVPELDWDRVLVDYLPRVRAAETAPAYYRVLRQCMALLQDGHSDVTGPSDDPTATLPIALAGVGGKAIVAAVRAPESIPDAARRREVENAALVRGDEITAIDGVDVQEILQRRIHPFLSSSTPQHRATRAYRQLADGEAGTKARLSVRPLQGPPREVVLTRGYLAATWAIPERANGEVADGIVYVALDSFGSESAIEGFEAELPRIRGARGLILDVRWNGGGSTNVAAKVIGSLTDVKLPGSRWKTRMHRPAFKAWGEAEAWHEGKHGDVMPRKDPFLGPVVVLTGPQTFSAAEDFLVVLKAARRATLVGERTAGSTGQPLRIADLPGGGVARVCAKRDTFPDGTEFVGIGVVPDVEVAPTQQDFAGGRDVVFERGLAEVQRLAR